MHVMSFLKRAFLAFAVALYTPLAWAGGESLRIVHNFPTYHPVHALLVEMVPDLEAAADYSARFEVYSAEQLGAGYGLPIEAVLDGQYDFLLTSAGALSANGVDVGPLVRNDLFVDIAALESFPESYGETVVKALFARSGLDMMGATWVASDYLAVNTEIKSWDDLQGLKIRTMAGAKEAGTAEVWERLGMRTVAIGEQEAISAMNAGALDAAVVTGASGDVKQAGWPMAKFGGNMTVLAEPIGSQVAWLVAREDWTAYLDPYSADRISDALQRAMLQMGQQLFSLDQQRLQAATEAGGGFMAVSAPADPAIMQDAIQQAWETSLSARDLSIAEAISADR